MMESPGRVAFSIGGFDVMWYGIMIALGIMCGFLVIYYRAPRYHEISSDRAFNLVILILIAALIGTRAYYVAFEWNYYGAHPDQIFNFRAGGLAIHGGLIFGCLMAALLARLWREKFFNIADLFFVAIPLGQAIGRWGNFFNSEAHGVHTDLPWAVLVDGDAVHPTFLYESIWCLILFAVLWRVDNRRKFAGQTFLLYCILYSIERFFVEGLRTDSLIVRFPWGEYRQAQVLSLCAFVCALILYALFSRKAKKAALAVDEAALIADEAATTADEAALTADEATLITDEMATTPEIEEEAEEEKEVEAEEETEEEKEITNI